MSHFEQHYDVSVEIDAGVLDVFSFAIYRDISANSVHSTVRTWVYDVN